MSRRQRQGCHGVAPVACGIVLAVVLAACSGASGGTSASVEATDASSESTVATAALPGQTIESTVAPQPPVAYAWQRLRIGAGGYVTGLVAHPSRAGELFARTDAGGAYRWDATSATWQQLLVADAVPDALAHPGDYSVESLAVSPGADDVVYVSVGNDYSPDPGKPLAGTGRVLRSVDGGQHWTAAGRTFFIGGNEDHRYLGERLAVDPADADHVLLGTRREGLWASSDGGSTWTQVPTDLVPIGRNGPDGSDQAGITFVSFDAAQAGRVFAGVAGRGVYRSDDAGGSWRRIEAVDDVLSLPTQGQVVAGVLYVAFNRANGDGVATVRTYAAAADRWEKLAMPADVPAWAFAVDPTDPARLVAAPNGSGGASLWHSLDGGRTWGAAPIMLTSATIPWLARVADENYLVLGRLLFDPTTPGRLWWADGIGVATLDDVAANPATLVERSTGIEELVTTDLVVPAGGVPVSAVADFQGFRHIALDAYPSAPLVDSSFAGGTGIAVSGGSPKDLVWVGAEYNRYFEPDRRARGAYSTDGGATWTEFANMSKEQFGGEVAVSATDPSNIVWVPSYYGAGPDEYLSKPRGIYVTSNRGGSWTHLADVGGTNDFHRFVYWLGRHALAADTVDGGVFYLWSGDGRFFVSADGGRHWTKAAPLTCTTDGDCPVVGQLRSVPDHAGELWAAAGTDGLFHAVDRAANGWAKLASVTAARAIAIGPPLAGSQRPTIYLEGTIASDPVAGLWRSTDDGATWASIGRAPLGIYNQINALSADPDHPGRVFVGFGGSGFVYGDPVA